MFNFVKHAFGRMCLRKPESTHSTASAGGAALMSELEFANWHGDHWANLLSAPIDARHYVLEDWTIPPLPVEFNN